MPVEPFDPRPPLRELLRETFAGRDVRVLEAGCGIFDHLELPEYWSVTGLDVSREALDGNPRLDDRILGDLQDVDIPPEFDLAICWDVLEHLPRPGDAIANMARALRPGGLLVINVPLRTNFKGWVTRLTPFAVHVWYYKHVLGWETAGQPGHRPFPTYHRRGMGPPAIRGQLGALGFTESWGRLYATDHYDDILHRYGAVSTLTRWVCRLATAVTFGRMDGIHSDYIGVHRRGDARCDEAGGPGASGGEVVGPGASGGEAVHRAGAVRAGNRTTGADGALAPDAPRRA